MKSEKLNKKLEKYLKKGKYKKYRKLRFKHGEYYNILSYITDFKYSFDEKPFTDADSLVLCQLAYTDLSDFKGKKLSEIAENVIDSKKVAPYCHDDCMKVIDALTQSERLGGIVVLDAREKLSKEEDCQYGVTLFDCGEFLYMACRGTDDHMIGWLEDVDLIIMPEIRSHELTIEALNEYGKFYEKPFIVGGHSKGGNMALYSAAFCDATVQDRIIKVYDHDGPGLLPSTFEKEEMKNIIDRVDKTCPELSVFGMIMHEGVPYRVVYSHCHDIYQHYIFNWQIEKTDGTCVKAEITDRVSRVVRIVIEIVLPTMTEEDRMRFRAFTASILDRAGIFVLGDFSFGKILKLIGKMFGQPWSEQKFMWGILGKVLKAIPKAEKAAKKEKNEYKKANKIA